MLFIETPFKRFIWNCKFYTCHILWKHTLYTFGLCFMSTAQNKNQLFILWSNLSFAEIWTGQDINNGSCLTNFTAQKNLVPLNLMSAPTTPGLIHPKPKITTQSPNTVLSVASWQRLYLAGLPLQPVSVWCAKVTTAQISPRLSSAAS